VDDAVVQGSVEEVSLTGEELQLADQLIASLVTGECRFLGYQDAYREALESVIEDKLAGKEPVRLPEPQQRDSTDLMAALKASLQTAKVA